MIGKNEPALLLRLRGGLGNQLFEYAAGRALALRNRVPLWLDTTSGFCGDAFGRSYALGAFNVVYAGIQRVSSTDLGIRAELFRRFVERRELLRMRALGRYFDPAIYSLRIKRPTVLDAYCQAPGYFREIEERLRQELEFRHRPLGLNHRTAGAILEANSVCLHVRRLLARQADGSMRQSVADFCGTCDMEYYLRAIRELASMYGRLGIFVFSDDVDWARQHAGAFETEGCSVQVVDDDDPLRCFYLMRLCKHFIIAISTFSWWAAWLGGHAMKTVCVPPAWNRGERRLPRDLFPPGWRIVGAAAPSGADAGSVRPSGRAFLSPDNHAPDRSHTLS